MPAARKPAWALTVEEAATRFGSSETTARRAIAESGGRHLWGVPVVRMSGPRSRIYVPRRLMEQRLQELGIDG